MRKSLSWIVPFLLLAVSGGAGPVPILNVADLVKRADLVVMGRITYVTDRGPASIHTPNVEIVVRKMSGEIQVDQVLKGTRRVQSVRFQFDQPVLFMGYRGVAQGTYLVLFLAGSNEPYRFANPYYPAVIAPPGTEISSEDAVDKVFEAVAAVLRSRDSSPADKREAIDTMRGAKNAPARDALRGALGESDRDVQLNAAAALLAANDLTALPIATEALLQSQPQLQPLPGDGLLNLRGAISHDLTAEKAVPWLVRLLGAKDAATRRAAATALGRTNSADAIAALGEALDDPDFEVRLATVRSLADLTGQRERKTSVEVFRANEPRFLDYWKRWIAERRQPDCR